MTAGLRIERLGAGDAEADGELSRFFDACPTSFAQQTPAWRDVLTGLGADEPMFLACRDAAGLAGVLPAYRFEGPLGAILNSVPQAGPLGGVALRPGAAPEPVYRSLLAAWSELAADADCALATLITNPLWPDRELCAHALRPDFELENTCLVLDLGGATDDEEAFPRASAHLQRNLRRARAAGYRIDEEQSPENLAKWYAIHAARHREIGATPLPRGLFTGALEHMVPRDKGRFFFIRSGETDELVGGGFYVHHGQVVDALMPSVDGEHARRGANYRLAEHTIRWARARGLRHYNWQASPPRGGVERFKRQWGSRDVRYAFLTRVTGDASRFLAASPAEIRAGYPWHYALPFDRVGSAARAGAGASSRERAWNALESTR